MNILYLTIRKLSKMILKSQKGQLRRFWHRICRKRKIDDCNPDGPVSLWAYVSSDRKWWRAPQYFKPWVGKQHTAWHRGIPPESGNSILDQNTIKREAQSRVGAIPRSPYALTLWGIKCHFVNSIEKFNTQNISFFPPFSAAAYMVVHYVLFFRLS